MAVRVYNNEDNVSLSELILFTKVIVTDYYREYSISQMAKALTTLRKEVHDVHNKHFQLGSSLDVDVVDDRVYVMWSYEKKGSRIGTQCDTNLNSCLVDMIIEKLGIEVSYYAKKIIANKLFNMINTRMYQLGRDDLAVMPSGKMRNFTITDNIKQLLETTESA